MYRRIRRGHCLSRLINEWEYLMHGHFLIELDIVIQNGTDIPDPETMLQKRKQLEDEILKFN